MEVKKSSPHTLDDGPAFYYVLAFQDGGHWYQLEYVCGSRMTSLPPTVLKYSESVRVER